jgi:hypothetical protein
VLNFDVEGNSARVLLGAFTFEPLHYTFRTQLREYCEAVQDYSTIIARVPVRLQDFSGTHSKEKIAHVFD